MTLVEVTAGILLLSTLLVASIVAFQRHARQIKRASRAAAAVDAADNMLSRWFHAGAPLPLQGEGGVRGDDSLQWRTTVIGEGQSDAVAWQVVRLQISDVESSSDEKTLAEVAVVVPRGWPSQAVP